MQPNEKKHQTERQDKRKEMGLRAHAGREPACRNWFRELRLSFRWWTVVRQDACACVLPGGKNTCPWRWRSRPRRTARTRGAV